MSPSRRKLVPALAIWVVAAGVVAAAHGAGLLRRLEWLCYDARVALLRSDRQASPRIAVVLVDEASLRALDPLVGRWPWPRSLFADLLEFLSLGDPRAVAFDILFTERQGTGGALGRGGDPDDLALAEATARAGKVYHAAQILRDADDEWNSGVLNRPLPADAERFALGTEWEPMLAQGAPARPNNNAYLPIPALRRACRGIGSVDLEPDADGVFRRAPLARAYQGRWFPSLALAPVIGLSGRSPALPADEPPLDSDGNYLVNLYGRFDTYSISGLFASLQLLRQGEIDDLPVRPDEFRDKIVFVGASAVGVGDLKPTPVSPKTPGVLLHAAIASNLLLGDFLTRPPPALTLTVVLLLAAAATAGVLWARLPVLQFAAPPMLGVGYAAWNVWRFAHNQVWPVVSPLAAVGIAGTLSLAYLAFTEGRDRRRVRRMFSQYVSPTVLAEVVDRYEDHLPTRIATKEHLTVLFSDLRGFTSLAEALPPAQVVDLLNLYFAEMTDAVFHHQGTIDKFIGDALMCFWGAPVRSEDHGLQAVSTALAMRRRLPGLNATLVERGYPAVQMGVGIATGEVILGNVGSERKLDYTVIGDEVNLASRLEGLTKVYRTPILLAESTYRSLEGRIPCGPVDLVRVKGKSHPIRVYRPLLATAPAGPDHGEARRLAAEMEEAFGLYLERRWREALLRYPRLPGDGAGEVFVARCEALLRREPPPDWDGIRAFNSP